MVANRQRIVPHQVLTQSPTCTEALGGALVGERQAFEIGSQSIVKRPSPFPRCMRINSRICVSQNYLSAVEHGRTGMMGQRIPKGLRCGR